MVGLIAAVEFNKFHLELFGGRKGNNMKTQNQNKVSEDDVVSPIV